MNGYLYINSTPVDDDTPYIAGWNEIRWGRVESREPAVIETAGGSYEVAPLATAMGARRGRVVIYAETIDVFDKQRVLSELAALMHGRKTIHLGSRQLTVHFFGADEVENESRSASRAVGCASDFIAADPLWRLNQPLKGVYTPVFEGEEFSLYDDSTIPPVVPPWEFTAASFTLENWGTAFTYGAGAITSGPASTTVYLKGQGANRVAVALDANGDGTFAEADAFYLGAGDDAENAIRVENAAGALIVPGPGFSISFGDTYMRFF